MIRKMAEFTEDLYFSTIGEWNAELKAKQVSAVELTRAFAVRLEKLGPRYNALALPLTEKAVRRAKAIDDDIKRDRMRSPLIGIPFGAKDLLSSAGTPTAWGAKPFAGQVFDEDAAAGEEIFGADEDVFIFDFAFDSFAGVGAESFYRFELDVFAFGAVYYGHGEGMLALVF